MVPILETARLRLRSYEAGDLEAQAAMLADPKVVRHFGGTPATREEAWRRILAACGAWSLLGYGYWAVERRSDGTTIGQVGFADFKRDTVPSIEGLPEMGWIFASHVHRQGYAEEAVKAGLAWADDALAGQEIVAIVAPGNGPSIGLAQKVGFGRPQEALYNGSPTLLFRRAPRDTMRSSAERTSANDPS